MNYRLYSFVNHLYMSPLQWGIQTAHCVSNIMAAVGSLKDDDPQSYQMVVDWAQSPTIIVCQGGNVSMLNDLYHRLGPLAFTLALPYTKFHEDAESLGGVITAVAVLVPEIMYDVETRQFPGGGLEFLRPDGSIIAQAFDPELYDFLCVVKTARLA